MKNLKDKISDFFAKTNETMKKVFYEFSYQTGIGWKYEPDDKYKDRVSRRLQRNYVSPNNLVVRSSGWDYPEEEENKRNL